MHGELGWREAAIGGEERVTNGVPELVRRSAAERAHAVTTMPRAISASMITTMSGPIKSARTPASSAPTEMKAGKTGRRLATRPRMCSGAHIWSVVTCMVWWTISATPAIARNATAMLRSGLNAKAISANAKTASAKVWMRPV